VVVALPPLVAVRQLVVVVVVLPPVAVHRLVVVPRRVVRRLRVRWVPGSRRRRRGWMW